MYPASTWNPINTAPREGKLCLLFDENSERSAGLPRGRRVHNDHMVVGRWHSPRQQGEKADWVTDVRDVSFDGDQPLWEARPIAATHWMPLPDAPPRGAWQDITPPPLAYEYVLICVPGLSAAREYPMKTDDPAGDMIVGCHGDAPHADTVTWWSDLCEADIIGNDPEDLVAEPARISPAYWMELPLPPS